MSERKDRPRTEDAGLSATGRAEVDAEAAWETELARRLEEIESGRARGEAAEKVFSELRAKYSCNQ